MNNQSESIESRTEELLRQHNEFQIPIRVRKLANKLGLRITQTDLKDALSGALFVKEKTVVLNRLHPVARKRFTIAHEIGHFQLHSQGSRKDFLDGIFKRDRNENDGHMVEEIQANQFAAAILMPKHEVIKEFQKLDTKAEDFILTLANKFRVSQESMNFRLLNLGLISSSQN